MLLLFLCLFDVFAGQAYHFYHLFQKEWERGEFVLMAFQPSSVTVYNKLYSVTPPSPSHPLLLSHILSFVTVNVDPNGQLNATNYFSVSNLDSESDPCLVI
jgi:hypothetical protein